MGRRSVLLCQLTVMLGLSITPLFAEEWPLPAPVSVGPLRVQAVRWVDRGYNATWAPDGNFFIFSRRRDGLFRCQADGSRETRLSDTDVFCDLSPDGTTVLFCQIQTAGERRRIARGIGLMNADGSQRRMINEWGTFAEWSPDGRHFLCHSGRSSILPNRPSFVYDRSGKLLRRIEHSWTTRPYWSADGKYLAYVGKEDRLYLADGDGTAAREVGQLGEGDSLVYMSWSPKGHRLLYWRRGDSLSYVTPSGQPAVVSKRIAVDGWPVSWSPTGDRAVVTEQGDKEGWAVSLVRFDASEAPQILFHASVPVHPGLCWDERGTHFYYRTDAGVSGVSADGKMVGLVGQPEGFSPARVFPGTDCLLSSRWMEGKLELWLFDLKTRASACVAPGFTSWSPTPAPGGRAMTVWAKPGPSSTKSWPSLLLFRIGGRG